MFMTQNHSGARKSTRKGLRWDGEGLWDWNLESNRIHFSPRWISLIGHQDHELSNTPDEWFQRVHPDDSARLLRDIEVARTEGSEFEFRYRLRHKDGTYRWMTSRGVVVRNDRREAIRLTGSQSDVTVETVTDPITRLPNRLLLLDRLAQSIDRARHYKAFHFAVLLIDLGRPAGDGQKSRGSGGDALLTATARRLETSLRIHETTPSFRKNDLAARLDGDQFAILLNGLKDVSHAKIVGDRILRELLSPFALNGRECRLYPSIGIAVSATGYTQANDVLHDAETALHRAQMLGGSDCELFDTAILKSEQAELQLEGEFEASLERREFELLYQPIVSLTSNQVVGFEALVRWKHPALGLILPLDFIPIAEATGFIVPLGHWILRDACQRLRIWQTSLPHAKDVWISVNLSSVQLRHEELAEQVAEILAESGLDPGSLVLELTEGVAMENPMAVKSMLMRLRAMGVRISIDDFGTGYSSLAYLHQVPLDALKVDRSFVRGMVTDKDTTEIVASIIAMARQLRLHIVAEGVENEDQLAALRALQCSAAQGHLFAKPLEASDAAALLSTGLPAWSRRATSANPRDDKRPLAQPLIPSLFGSRRRVLIAASFPVLLAAATLVRGFYRAPAADSISNRVSAKPAQPQEKAITPDASAGHASEAKPPDSSGAKSPDDVPMKPAAATASSVAVQHLHRIGSCRGRLIVAPAGISFVPEKDGDDGFALPYAEFVHALVKDTLTLTTATKSYRFRVAAAKSGEDQARQLRKLAEKMGRFRVR